MSQTRTPAEKAADALFVYNVLRDEVTPPIMREVLGNMTNAQKASEAGDVQAFAALVQASLQLQRVIAANDRMSMLAAAMLTSSGMARPVIEDDES